MIILLDKQLIIEVACLLKTVTHPSTNRAQHKVTLLIETNALPLSHATTTCKSQIMVTLCGTAAGGDEAGTASVEEQVAAAEDEDANQSNANVVDVDKSSKPTSPAGQTTVSADTSADGQYSVLDVDISSKFPQIRWDLHGNGNMQHSVKEVMGLFLFF